MKNKIKKTGKTYVIFKISEKLYTKKIIKKNNRAQYSIK